MSFLDGIQAHWQRAAQTKAAPQRSEGVRWSEEGVAAPDGGDMQGNQNERRGKVADM